MPKPVVFSTERARAIELDEFLASRHDTSFRLTPYVESRVAMQGEILSEHGVRFREVKHTPENLGYDQRRFMIAGRQHRHEDIDDALRRDAPQINVIQSTRLLDADLTDETPVVLKRPDTDSHGVNKFLVREAGQRAALDRFRNDHHDLAAAWYTQPFVEGPVAGVNGSFRIVADATGSIISAALFYTEIHDGFELRVNDGTEAHLDAGDWDDVFYSPESPYYLGDIRDVRSNSPLHRAVPLSVHGDFRADRRRITKRDRQVAEDFGLDGLAAPTHILDWTTASSRVVGPHIGLLLGNDYAAGGDPRQTPLFEVNVDPGTHSTRLWHNQPMDADMDRFVLGLAASHLAQLG